MPKKRIQTPAATRSSNRRARREMREALGPAPIFVLVEPQMGENIGASARGMLNFGVSGLRLVKPRDSWPNSKAGALAAGASIVLDQARLFTTTGDAVADCNFVLATTARSREMLLPVLTPREAAAALKSRVGRGETCAVLFGGERAGLTNSDVAQADAIVSIPVNPAFASLNLSQAVLILAYEWAQADGRENEATELDQEGPAPRKEFDLLMAHLYDELDKTGYFFPPARSQIMQRNLRTLFTRGRLTQNEIRTLRGVIKSLSGRRGDKSVE